MNIKLKVARKQETYICNQSEWDTPTIKIAAEYEYNDEPLAVIIDEDSIIYDDVNKREIAFEELMRLDISGAVARMTFEQIEGNIYYCEIVIVNKWRKKRK